MGFLISPVATVCLNKLTPIQQTKKIKISKIVEPSSNCNLVFKKNICFFAKGLSIKTKHDSNLLDFDESANRSAFIEKSSY